MITIGINPDCYLGQPIKNDRGTLEVVFKQVTGDLAAQEELKKKLAENPFADWDEGGYTDDGEGVNIRLLIFPFDSKPPQSSPDKVIDATEMKLRIDSVRAPLYHILEYFITAKDSNPMKATDIFNKTGISNDPKTGSNFAAKIMDEAVQEKVYNNIVDIFIKGVAPYVDKTDNLFRLKLARQSAKKAFPTLPTKFLGDRPFMESMKIPLASSKLGFTAWEKANGYDSDLPISSDTADSAGKKKGSATQEQVLDPFAEQ